MRENYITNADRIVVKLGTGVLTNSLKHPDPAKMQMLASQIAFLYNKGKEIILVTSGAVGAGMGALGFEKRPTELSELQACAAVGQSLLMAKYEAIFSNYKIPIAQVLLTHDDLEHHDRHLNARNTLITLLKYKVIPIINENDAVSSYELKFGDNDKLSALVACLLPADLLIIMTTVDGLMENFGTQNARLIHEASISDPSIVKLAHGTKSETSVGGMKTKIQAAKIVTRAGIPMIIASGQKPDTLNLIFEGKPEGTLFIPQEKKLKSRKRWIAFFHYPKGTLIVDEGAKKAIREQGKSLLLPGIKRCDGEFQAGEVVRICDEDGTEFARGLTRFDANKIRSKLPINSEVIHRNDLVVL
jgi:glutamate 5-kinase